MPPGPAYNWFCVLASTAEIVSNAARYRASQLTPKTLGTSYANPRKRRRTEDVEQEVAQDIAQESGPGPVESVSQFRQRPEGTTVSSFTSSSAFAHLPLEIPVIERVVLDDTIPRTNIDEDKKVLDELATVASTIEAKAEVAEEVVDEKLVSINFCLQFLGFTKYQALLW